MKLAHLGAVALLAGVAACGSAAQPGNVSSGNTLVCQHWATQRAWAKHLAKPTLADAVKLEGYVGADSAEAKPGTVLARDFNTFSSDMANQKPEYAASMRVIHDCEALGTKFSPAP